MGQRSGPDPWPLMGPPYPLYIHFSGFRDQKDGVSLPIRQVSLNNYLILKKDYLGQREEKNSAKAMPLVEFLKLMSAIFGLICSFIYYFSSSFWCFLCFFHLILHFKKNIVIIFHFF